MIYAIGSWKNKDKLSADRSGQSYRQITDESDDLFSVDGKRCLHLHDTSPSLEYC